MRITIDARAIGPRFPGIGRATLGLLRGLRELEQEQFVVLYPPLLHGLITATGVDADPRFELIVTPAAPIGLSQQWRLPLLARPRRSDVWHAPYYVRPFWGLPPTLATVFDTIGVADGGQGLRPVARRLLWNGIMRLSLGAAAHVVTSSRAARLDIQQAYAVPSADISVVPLAADEHFRPQSERQKARVRQAYALPNEYVLCLGSNKPHKNLATLVEAWARLERARAGRNLCLVIAGRDDPRYRSARIRAAELGLADQVRFLPDVPDDDLPPLLAGAVCFVYPSLREGFGLTPLEAMACGTPVVVSNRTSLPEVVGNAGLLVEPDAPGLANGVARLLDNPALRDELRERGLRQAAQFSWRRTAAEMLEIYLKVAQ